MKPIKGYEGLYSIDINGNILGHVQDKYLKHGMAPNGRRVRLCKNGYHTSYQVANLIVKTFIDENKHVIEYKDGDKFNINIDNLKIDVIMLSDKQIINKCKAEIEDLKMEALVNNQTIINMRRKLNEYIVHVDNLEATIKENARQIGNFEGYVNVLKLKNNYDKQNRGI